MLHHRLRAASGARRSGDTPLDYVAAWYAEDASGTSQPDRSGNGYTGLATGATLASDVWFFDGVDDRVVFGDVLDSLLSGSNQKFSFTIRASCTSSSSNQALISKLGDSTLGEENRQFLFRLQSGVPQFLWNSTTDSTIYRGVEVAGGPDLRGHGEVEVTMCYDGAINTNNGRDRLKFYISGVEYSPYLSLTRGSLLGIANSTAQLSLGAAVGSANTTAAYPFGGSVKRVAVFDRTLSLSDHEYFNSEVI